MRVDPRILIPAALLAVSLTACSNNKDAAAKDASAAKAAPAASKEPPLRREDSVLVNITARVQAIDLVNREISLKGPSGNVVNCTVDKSVTRLDEVKPGDLVNVGYYVSVAGELRPPTDEEKKNPIAVVEGEARAPKSTDPAGGAVRTIRMVTTVQAIDMTAQTVTLKNPRGDQVAVKARYPENLKKIKVGDTIVVSYTEAFAVSLEKTGAR